ncbi:HTH domain-containing protein (plasmid) [Arsenophonus sp. aPb]|uniref:HTH domain-containing protein n=1 Tax=Arsenophonus sp. aPb TaxID=3041619 RepID=UPI0024699FD1|nr:HTH domain-containing protein [Arsenophonus sp. aPb]WGL99839.1 HTH domain-containing protein [Arsenophonus sp. aPb]
MALDGKVSRNEQLMIKVLESSKEPLNLNEIVEAINILDKNCLVGKSPSKSLYSIIYRREKRRSLNNEKPIFIVSTRGGAKYYSINKKAH